MDDKVNSVRGGISVFHKVQQGKHHYEVDRVVEYKKGHVAGPYVRKGDKLLKINGQDLENLNPETFAELLTKGSPMLTIHQSSRDTPQDKCKEQQGMYPFNKERTILQLSLEMCQEEELEDEHQENGGEDDSGHPNNEKDPPEGDNHLCELDDLLLVSMTKTSISIVKGRGCDDGSPCYDCGGTGCNLNDMVMVTKSTKLTLVSRGITNLLQEKIWDNVLIRNLLHHEYIYNRDRTAAMSRNYHSNAEISIYYYKSDWVAKDAREFLGAPVVLNFSGTECFLNCTSKDDKVILGIESCDKSKLKHIISGDKETWPFVFYMKQRKDRSRRFESANCPGWFIHAKNENVAVKPLETEDETFLFIIQKSCQ